ncbi:MAG: murein L,D-transpeptidase catalytic domain family protein [Allosphingosinicella sp.]|uniref:murein L,D-transpeptidase catalytic domain family protein n=1 Tax=Allosphingosinicella sp. TaxID=2823234 RepID=UPI00395D35D8
MQLSRRQIIGAGAASGIIGIAAGSPLLAAALQPTPAGPDAEPLPAPPPPEPAPARPRVAVDPVVDQRLLARARASFDRHRNRLTHTDLVGIADFGKASREARFYILDTNSGRVSRHLVSHGRGSDPGHTGFLQRFSNAPGSNATSDGAYLSGVYYHGKYGRSMRLHGLDPSNSNAEARAIVVHSAWYAEPDVVEQHGKLGRSEGCFAFSYASLQEVLERLGPGRFLYADRV